MECGFQVGLSRMSAKRQKLDFLNVLIVVHGAKEQTAVSAGVQAVKANTEKSATRGRIRTAMKG